MGHYKINHQPDTFYYAVHKGKTPGVFKTEAEAARSIYKFKVAQVRKFKDYDQAMVFFQTGNSVFVKTKAGSSGSSSNSASTTASNNVPANDSVAKTAPSDGR